MALHSSADQTLMPNFTDPDTLVDAALSVLSDATGSQALLEPALAPSAQPASAPTPSRSTPGKAGTPVRARVSSSRILHEAAGMAADGEIGNTKAIALLDLPHTHAELLQILRTFGRQLTREARAKIAREAYMPLPAGVGNQRYEPLFDRYPISGKTYTTAKGVVVLNEVQYYNGEMVQVYGECSNLADVRAALTGSGYKPLILRHSDGREAAAVQFWSHHLSDTSLFPYNAMFIIVVAVPDDAPDSGSSIRSDGSGAATVLSMLNGTFSEEHRRYTNHARLYYHRLLDSTQVAIDVGRERMGTDKRPGMIDRSRSGNRLIFSVRDGIGRGVAKIDLMLTDDAAACAAMLADAARVSGIALPELPPGTECVYPSVARIGNAPIMLWDWRTDLTPRLQRVTPTTMIVDPASDEGSTLMRWGFRPSVIGHLPNVRGVVTGVPDAPSVQ
jgi:hypothetical protein